MATTRRTKATNSNSTGVVVKVKRLDERAQIPKMMTDEAACFDVATIEDVYVRTLNAEDRATLIHTGLAFEIPKGYHMKVFLRSSTGYKTKLRLANQVGIVDSDYVGELLLIVENPSRNPVKIAAGTRIAQCLIEKNIPVVFQEVEELKESTHGGLGSTGER